MEPLFTQSDLVRIAVRWGKSPSFVRRAVDRGLLPSAKPQGSRSGVGVEWYYDASAVKALRALLHLDARGYRGKSLRFALWWLGLGSWSQDIPAFAIALGRQIRTQALWRLTDRSADPPGPSVAIAVNAKFRDGDAEEYADAEWVRQCIAFASPETLATNGAALIKTSLGVDVDPGTLTLVAQCVIAGLFGVAPADLGLHPERHVGYAQNILCQTDAPDKVVMLPLVTDALRQLAHSQWFEGALLRLERSSPAEWECMRILVRQSGPNRILLGCTRRVIREVIRQGLVSPRTVERHPVLRTPSILILALFVGMGVILGCGRGIPTTEGRYQDADRFVMVER